MNHDLLPLWGCATLFKRSFILDMVLCLPLPPLPCEDFSELLDGLLLDLLDSDDCLFDSEDCAGFGVDFFPFASFSNSSAGCGAGPCGPLSASSLTSWEAGGAVDFPSPSDWEVLRCSVVVEDFLSVLLLASVALELDGWALALEVGLSDVESAWVFLGSLSPFVSAFGSCGAVVTSVEGASGCSIFGV